MFPHNLHKGGNFETLHFKKSIIVNSVEKMTSFFERFFVKVYVSEMIKNLMMQKQKNCNFCNPHHNNSSIYLECECHCHS